MILSYIDHGIGKFGGLKKIDVEGVQQEAIKLKYGEGIFFILVFIHFIKSLSLTVKKDIYLNF